MQGAWDAMPVLFQEFDKMMMRQNDGRGSASRESWVMGLKVEGLKVEGWRTVSSELTFDL
jgi:hypothetical protein